MAKLHNLVRMYSATPGTGALTLGTAVPGFLTFDQAGVSDGAVVSYGAKEGAKSEVGIGTYSSTGPTLTRTTVRNSTNGNAAVSFAGNNVEVFITPLAEDFRERLTADRTYYIRTDGSDSNTGLANSSAGALQTFAGAKSVLSALDLNGFTVTFQVGAGTYTGNISLSGPVLNGLVIYQGDTTTPSNVLISLAGNCVFATNGAILTVKGFKLTSSANNCMWATNGGVINFQNIDFGSASSGRHMRGDNFGILNATGNYTISGGAQDHILLQQYGQYIASGNTVTLSGTPAFSGQFLNIIGGQATMFSVTFSGAATGKRYTVTLNGVINSFGAGTSSTYFPGNSNGTTATGGQQG